MYRRAVHAHFVRACAKKRAHIVYATHAAAHRKRYEQFFRYPPHHIDDGIFAVTKPMIYVGKLDRELNIHAYPFVWINIFL